MNQTTQNRWQRWLPTPGTVIFTLLMFIIIGPAAFGMPSFRSDATSNTQANLIPYQGYLTDANGNPGNGLHTITLALYDAPTGGTLLWGPETHSNVTITEGTFDLNLGSLTSGGVPIAISRESSYLEIKVNNDTLSPRELLFPQATGGGMMGKYPYLFHLRAFGLYAGNHCHGYWPGDPNNLENNPYCFPDEGVMANVIGPTMIVPTGTGYVYSANNMSKDGAQLGYGYSFFLTNSGATRNITLPLGSCNDVAIYVTSGESQADRLGTDSTLVYHRFPVQAANTQLSGCPCANLDPTFSIPSGDFRLTFLTRGNECTSYFRLGDHDAGALPVGSWIENSGLSTDWNNLSRYFGQ